MFVNKSNVLRHSNKFKPCYIPKKKKKLITISSDMYRKLWDRPTWSSHYIIQLLISTIAGEIIRIL